MNKLYPTLKALGRITLVFLLIYSIIKLSLWLIQHLINY